MKFKIDKELNIRSEISKYVFEYLSDGTERVVHRDSIDNDGTFYSFVNRGIYTHRTKIIFFRKNNFFIESCKIEFNSINSSLLEYPFPFMQKMIELYYKGMLPEDIVSFIEL